MVFVTMKKDECRRERRSQSGANALLMSGTERVKTRRGEVVLEVDFRKYE
jgi:hypothetical protein